MLAKEFKASIYLHEQPAYRIAMQAEIEPSLFSKWLRGMRQPTKDDLRLKKVATIIGYSGKIFED
jgi:hypothetical protein